MAEEKTAASVDLPFGGVSPAKGITAAQTMKVDLPFGGVTPANGITAAKKKKVDLPFGGVSPGNTKAAQVDLPLGGVTPGAKDSPFDANEKQVKRAKTKVPKKGIPAKIAVKSPPPAPPPPPPPPSAGEPAQMNPWHPWWWHGGQWMNPPQQAPTLKRPKTARSPSLSLSMESYSYYSDTDEEQVKKLTEEIWEERKAKREVVMKGEATKTVKDKTKQAKVVKDKAMPKEAEGQKEDAALPIGRPPTVTQEGQLSKEEADRLTTEAIAFTTRAFEEKALRMKQLAVDRSAGRF